MVGSSVVTNVPFWWWWLGGRDIGSWGGYTCVEGEDMWEISVPSTQFFYKPKTSLKKKSVKNKNRFTLDAVYRIGLEINGYDSHREEFLWGNKVPLHLDAKVLKCMRDD